ncbi:MAG TPA: ribose-phosphate diphosphokinase [Thermoanaerobaculia bacterium]|nr:ribose-phosphate diphosphokinase [Thermoanaerobaculia bacterium]
MTVVFSIAEYDYMADDLVRIGRFQRGAVERDVFPDGEHYLRIDSKVLDQHAVVIGGTISDKATLEIYDLGCAIVENGASTLTLIVPWYGYATMDRAARAGEAVIAKNRARIFSSIPAAALGNRILLLDLHSEGIPHYFEGSLHPVHVYAKPLIESLARDLAGSDFILGSTDAGRAKWVESLSNELGVPAAFVYKRRHGPEETEVTAVSTKLDGETIVIYDDMIRTGTSLLNAARAYRESGAGKMFAIATHGEFPDGALDRIQASGLFEAIACTDSHPRARQLRDRGLIVRPVAELFCPYLR